MFHAIERAIGAPRSFSGVSAILGEAANAGLKESSGRLRFRDEASRVRQNDARRQCPGLLPATRRRIRPAVASGGIDGAGMVPQKLADAHQRAAARQVPYLSLTDLRPSMSRRTTLTAAACGVNGLAGL